ncbi:MAG: hypothetical protein HYY04_12215, partial [Chloroflexi bacterium]|nr:hypothetical protein [Chloroflexota bacterium]
MSGVWGQYTRIKRNFPDALVLFRYGDFYELFGEDAEQAAPALGLALTSREMGHGRRVQMAGVPYHALESYLARILAAGFKAAIVEQVNTGGVASSAGRLGLGAEGWG